MEDASSLQGACLSVVRNDQCRQLLRDAIVKRPGKKPLAAAQKCANLYCPTLPDADFLTGCVHPLVGGESFGQDLEALRYAMLVHDFPNASERGEAVYLLLTMEEYVESVPRPEVKCWPLTEPKVSITIRTDGTYIVASEGSLQPAPSLAQLASLVPNDLERDGTAQIFANAEVAFQHVAAATGLLRRRGYLHVEFAVIH